MSRTLPTGVLAGVLLCAPATQAQQAIPFPSGPVPPGAVGPAPIVVGPAPATPGLVAGPAACAVCGPAAPMTPCQFAQAFRPIPGRHEAWLIHPGICHKVVHVCFTLPPGCPRVCVQPRRIVFDYGCCNEVVIVFKLFGHVDVEYH